MRHLSLLHQDKKLSLTLVQLSLYQISFVNNGNITGSLYTPGSYQYDEGVYDYDDDDGGDYTEEDDDKIVSVPIILSQPRIIQAEIGHDIILPCTVDNLPGITQ